LTIFIFDNAELSTLGINFNNVAWVMFS